MVQRTFVVRTANGLLIPCVAVERSQVVQHLRGGSTLLYSDKIEYKTVCGQPMRKSEYVEDGYLILTDSVVILCTEVDSVCYVR